jgi:hypothetical protein
LRPCRPDPRPHRQRRPDRHRPPTRPAHFEQPGVQGDFANPAGGGAALSIYAPTFHQNLPHNSGYPDNVNAAPNGWMTIVGIQRGHDYEIYSQVIQHNAVVSAQRIF